MNPLDSKSPFSFPLNALCLINIYHTDYPLAVLLRTLSPLKHILQTVTVPNATTLKNNQILTKPQQQQQEIDLPPHYITCLSSKSLRNSKSIFKYLIIINTSYLLFSNSLLKSGHDC